MKISVTTQNIIDVFGNCEKHVYVNPADCYQYACDLKSDNMNIRIVLSADELDSVLDGEVVTVINTMENIDGWKEVTDENGEFIDMGACDVLNALAKMVRNGCSLILTKK